VVQALYFRSRKKNMKNDLGIVVPVRGQEAYTRKFLANLDSELSDFMYDKKVNVVLMDSGGHEEFSVGKDHRLLEGIRDIEGITFTYHKVENPDESSYYKIWNDGTKLSDAKNVIMSNNDILVVPRTIYDLNYGLDNGYELVSPAQVATEREIEDTKINHFTEVLVVDGRVSFVGWLFGYTREYFDSVGGFNEKYKLWFADSEFFIRSHGRKVCVISSAGVFHFFSKTVSTLGRDKLWSVVKEDFETQKLVSKELGVEIDGRTDEEYASMFERYWSQVGAS